MSNLDLDALAALEADATPGGWEANLRDAPRDDTFVYAIDGDQAVADVDAPADAALIVALRNAAPALIAAARDRDRWHHAAFAGQAHEAQLTAERDAAQALLNGHRCDEQAERAYARAVRAEADLRTAQAALARVERLLIEARSLIATTGTGREAQIIKEALATIRAAAGEGQDS